MPRTEEETVDAAASVPEFRFYKPHPLLGAIYPAAQESELAALEQSILAVGVQHRIRVWTDDKNRQWVVDGRTRQEAASRAYQRRLAEDPTRTPVADNGIPIQPEVDPFTGTLDEVTQFMEVSHIRKNYTEGQRAGYGVKLYYYEYKQAHHGRLPTPAQEAEEDTGIAEKLAERFGVNVYYVRICRKLYREAIDLLDSVCAGHLPPKKADAALKERAAARARGEAPDAPGEEDADAPAPATPAPGDETVRDQDGTEVPERLRDAFAAAAVYDGVRKAVLKAARDIEELRTKSGGEYIDGGLFATQVSNVLKHLNAAKPRLVCGDCGGKGKVNRWDCKRCRATGYLPLLVLNAEKRAAKAEREKEAEAAG